MKKLDYPVVLTDGVVFLNYDDKVKLDSSILFANKDFKSKFLVNVLLVPFKDRLILIDTGIGLSISDDFFRYYEVSSQNLLLSKLQELDLSVDDITDVILTHLHFDHAGGAIDYNDKKLMFKNANYFIHKKELEYANYESRDKSSGYLFHMVEVFNEDKNICLVKDDLFQIDSDFYLVCTGGHTPGLMTVRFKIDDQFYIFPSDILPTMWHIRNNNKVNVDWCPLEVKRKKDEIIREALSNDAILFWQHAQDKFGFKFKLNRNNNLMYKRIVKRG